MPSIAGSMPADRKIGAGSIRRASSARQRLIAGERSAVLAITGLELSI
jgi:hypothetical protein